MAANNLAYETRFTATWMGAGVVNQATQDVNNFTKAIRESNTAAQQASQGMIGCNHATEDAAQKAKAAANATNTYNQSLMALRGGLFGIQMTLFLSSMLVSNMMTMEMATNNIESAQERLNRVVREGGRGTDEYRQAVRQLENAQINYNRAQTMTTIMSVSMGLQLVSMSAGFLQMVPNINKATAALRTFIATMTVAKALSIVGIASLVAGVGVAGWALSQQNQALNQSGNQNINVNLKHQDDNLYAGFARQDRNNITRVG